MTYHPSSFQVSEFYLSVTRKYCFPTSFDEWISIYLSTYLSIYIYIYICGITNGHWAPYDHYNSMWWWYLLVSHDDYPITLVNHPLFHIILMVYTGNSLYIYIYSNVGYRLVWGYRIVSTDSKIILYLWKWSRGTVLCPQDFGVSFSCFLNCLVFNCFLFLF